MPYVYNKVAPSPSWVAISAAGLVTIPDKSLVPVGGYTGIVRASVTDGINTTTIDIPITVVPKPASANVDYKVVESIATAATGGGAIIDLVNPGPAIITTAATGGGAIIDTAQTLGGGGGDEMTLIILGNAQEAIAPPSGAGTGINEIRHYRRRQTFSNALATGLQAQNYNNHIVDCVIERSQLWQYDDTGAEWIRVSDFPIFVQVTETTDGGNTTPQDYPYNETPTALKIKADYQGQKCIYRHVSQTANTGASGYAVYIARYTEVNNGVPGDIAGKYWTWISEESSTSEFD